MTALTAPIAPHELPEAARDQMSDLVRRVVASAAVEGAGYDLMIRVYMAGFHHAVAILAATPTQSPTDPASPLSQGEEGR